MKIQNIKYCLFLCLFSFQACKNNQECFDLRENAIFDSIPTKNLHSSGDNFYPDLNYTGALLESWKIVKTGVYKKTDSLCVSCNTEWDISGFSQTLCFVGDNKSIVSLAIEKNQVIGSDQHAEIKLQDPKKLILKKFEGEQIIMFNEAHDRAQTRAFILSILPELKKAGATCLAMETLNSDGNLDSLDNSTGFYTNEPIMGQIIREALKLNFKLVAYEPKDVGKYTSNERDSLQAKNIFEQIATETGIEKTVVIAGYGHISENSWDDSPLKFMAMYFKQMTKIDPVTVDQVIFIEGSSFNLLSTDTVKLIEKADFKKLGSGTSFFDDPSYDLFICHPGTKYIHNRPDWLVTSNDKKFTSIEIPGNIKPVLVQAYLTYEIKSDEDYKLKIPYDQTFESEHGKVWLVLNNKEKYNIVFRDQYNNIIHRIVK